MSFRTRLYGSPLYDLLLRVKAPDGLAVRPPDPWPGEPAIADRLFQGRYRFGDEEVVSTTDAPWTAPGASLTWLIDLHGFDWLRHFEAAGAEAATRHARALTGSWLRLFGRWQRLAWRADVLGRRLITWCSHAGMLLEGADAGFRTAFLTSMAKQVKHLHRDLASAPAGRPRLTALLAQVYAALCLRDERARLNRALHQLEREMEAQVLGDGGHASRNPSQHLSVLRDLIALRGALQAGQVPAPEFLELAIDRMTPMLRFFRHGDGGLALFHGSEEEVAAAIDLVLNQAGATGKPLNSATLSGYERLAARRGLVLFDAGSPPTAGGATPHAAPLAFEFSHGRERLIVNCGAAFRHDEAALAGTFASNAARGPWTKALMSTPAHSTLTFADINAQDAGENVPPLSVLVARDEQDGAIWLDTSHDGYRRRFGLTHHRKIYLASTGEDLRGEDTFDGPGLESAGGKRFAIRFHLHPSAQASLLQNGSTALVKSGSGIGWQFRAGGGLLELEPSVYFGRGREQRRNQQLVVTGMMVPGEPVKVKWAFTKVG